MSLLAFEDKSLLPEQDLIDGSRRMNTASEVNAAILQAQNLNKGTTVDSLRLFCAAITRVIFQTRS
jgi:hypothetical protein